MPRKKPLPAIDLKPFQEHPRYLLAMEILTSLPSPDCGLPVRLLLEDFGLRRQKDLDVELKQLKEDFGVKIKNIRSEGRVLFVPHSQWKRVQEAALDYWEVVHDDV